MALLVAFAVLAGAGTALTPCVLPVLPALLSASATGGRRRPLGVILGLTVTHVIAIVGIASVIDGVGLAGGVTRTLAICALILFGVALLWPRLGEVVERPFARLTRFGPSTAGSGFWSGVVVGGALGFLYAPCAGPILAAVISVAATTGASGELVAVAIGYALGSAVVLLALAYGGRHVIGRIRGLGRGPTLQRVLGVVMIATALAMSADLDIRFQTALANDLPAFVGNPTRALERSGAVEDRLASLRGRSRFDSDADRASAAGGYPELGPAPDFAGSGPWLNRPGGRPLTLAGLRGRVVLVDFWTYTCINCLRTLPHLRAWNARYARRGLTIVGVHTPEFSFEHDTANVKRAIASNRLRYPVLQDNDYATWSAWGNQFWPAKYLIDARGQVRYTHFGEGDYDKTEKAIRSLLHEAGHALPRRVHARGRRGALRRHLDPGDLPRLRARPRLRAGGGGPGAPPLSAARGRWTRAASPSRASGAGAASPPPRDATPRCRRASSRGRSSWC